MAQQATLGSCLSYLLTALVVLLLHLAEYQITGWWPHPAFLLLRWAYWMVVIAAVRRWA